MRTRTLARLSAVPLVLGLTAAQVALATPALAHGGGDAPTNTRAAQVEKQGEGTRMRHVANLQHDSSGEAQSGSDIEFMRLGQRDYALAGTLRKGLQVIDITQPRDPRRVAVFDCDISQGDIQVWKTDTRVLASYTADGTVGAAGAASQCGRDLQLEAGDAGTVLVDLTTPSRPRSLSFLPVPQGSHNMTLHPSGDYLYNSNSDLYSDDVTPNVTIYDVRNPRDPKQVQEYELPFTPGSLGTESHDITFDARGNRAYVAALSQTLVLDTSNPAKPELVSKIVDPTINVVHQSDPFRVQRPDGSWRRLLIITDERAGAAASAECAGGGLHVYDIFFLMVRGPPRRSAPGSSQPRPSRPGRPAPATSSGSTRASR